MDQTLGQWAQEKAEKIEAAKSLKSLGAIALQAEKEANQALPGVAIKSGGPGEPIGSAISRGAQLGPAGEGGQIVSAIEFCGCCVEVLVLGGPRRPGPATLALAKAGAAEGLEAVAFVWGSLIGAGKARPPKRAGGEAQNSRSFKAMYNGVGTNQLSRVNMRGSAPEIDLATGAAVVRKGAFKAFIDEYNEMENKFSVSAQKLLDICVMALTEQNTFRGGDLDADVAISLDRYAELCGIPGTKASKDKARRTAEKDLETLLRTRFQWTERVKGKETDFSMANLCSQVKISNGEIRLSFSPEIAKYLVNAYVMQFPLALLKIDERNPSAYCVGRKLAQHFSMKSNQGKGTAGTISVKAILEWCEDTIPSYEQVMATNRNASRNIVGALEKALDALQAENVIKWEYCNGKGTPLSEGQLEKMGYQTFARLYIRFEIANAPALAHSAGKPGAKKPKPSRGRILPGR